MIAEVTLLRRMVRRLDFFDYAIPAEMEQSIQIGLVVKVPFRSGSDFGIVTQIRASTLRSGIKTITQIVGHTPVFHAEQLLAMRDLAHYYGVSLSDILNLALPPLGVKRLHALSQRQKTRSNSSPMTKGDEPKLFYYLYKNEIERIDYLKQQLEKLHKVIIILPQVEEVKNLVKILTATFPDHAVIPYYSDLTEKQRAENYFAFIDNDKALLIGTRVAAFVSLKDVDRVIIDREQDDDHKNWDSTPRFDARFVTRLFAARIGVPITLMSFSSSSDAYFRVHKKFISGDIDPTPISRVTCIDTSSERRFGNLDLLSQNTYDRIRRVIQKKSDTIIFVNQKGVASSMYCRDCSNDLICPDCKTNYAVSKENNQNYLACRRCLKHEPIPKNCPNCQSEKFGTRGAGIEKMSESLRGWLEKEKLLASVIIVSAEDKKTIANNRNDVNSRIFIATEAGLNRPIWSQTELAIIADFDRIRNSPDYLADERAWQLITHAHYLLKEQGELIIETREPKHYILRSLVEPHRFYRLNLNMRQTTQFPPYSLLVKYMVADRQPNLTLLRAKKALTELQTALTKADIHGNISGPTESMPKVRNGRYFYVILAKYKSDISLGAISDVHRTLSPDIKIDPNPMSLYNP